MRETTWIPETKDRIQEVAMHLLGTKTNCADFSVSAIRKANVRVYSKSDLYLNYLTTNFLPADYRQEIPLVTLYYDYGNASELRTLGYNNLDDINTPCIGLFDDDNHTGLITGLDEYGLLKSTVLGMYSKLLFAENWIPIHGAVIDFDGRGAIIIGHHGAGKSTALLNIIHRAKAKTKIAVLTDDWSAVRKDGPSVRIHSIEQKMSFSESFANENPELNLGILYKERVVDGIDKVWLDIEDVIGSGSYTQETTLKKVLVFSNSQSAEIIRSVPSNTVANLLVDSSYHMPDTGERTKERLLSFWGDVLSEIDCVQVNNRQSFRSKDEVYAVILDYLT